MNSILKAMNGGAIMGIRKNEGEYVREQLGDNNNSEQGLSVGTTSTSKKNGAVTG